MEIKDFIKQNSIKIDSELVGENPNMPEWNDAYHYKITLKSKAHQLTTYYSMGYAHTEEPKVDDVLDCLAMDASTAENSPTFEDFCAEFGYDTDSRKAEQTYKAILRGARQLKQFLGNDKYDFLLWEVERI